jgi:alpha-L-fucosidase
MLPVLLYRQNREEKPVPGQCQRSVGRVGIAHQRQDIVVGDAHPTSLLCGLAMLLACSVAVAREPIRAPATDWNMRYVKSYVETDPAPEYQHASEAAYEAFRDLKFGIRIHWGIYSIWARKGDASWPFLKLSDAEKQQYQELYKTWNPQGFDADEWMRFFERSGVKIFAFTTKHHEGFSMFDTKTRVKERANWTAPGGPKLEACDTAYSIMDAPFHRDVVKELCDAARRHDIKIDLYFSHPDWYDADFRDICSSPLSRFGKATPAERDRMMRRHREQLAELLTNYGKIDTICLDMFMDKESWPTLRQTMIELRKIQPDVMFRARGIGNYGDYYTPEGFVPGAKENTTMPWMVIYPLGSVFSFQPNEHYKGDRWIITNLIDAVAKGGNFMPAIGPDVNGRFAPEAIRQFEEAGKWLKVNGEAIYATRPRDGLLWKEGSDIRFTRSKDRKTIYALLLKWPGNMLKLRSVRPNEGSAIAMLGVTEPLRWRFSQSEGLTIDLPQKLQDERNRPCHNAWALRIESTDPAR